MNFELWQHEFMLLSSRRFGGSTAVEKFGSTDVRAASLNRATKPGPAGRLQPLVAGV